MKEKDKITEALAKLIQQTQDGKLKWIAIETPRDLISGTEDIVDTVYEADKGNRCMRLFPYKTRYYTDEEVYHWIDNVALEISDKSESSWWRFPSHQIIWDLLDAVKFRTVDVEGFINDLFSEENGS